MKIIPVSKGIDKHINIEVDWENFIYVCFMVISQEKRNMELDEIKPIGNATKNPLSFE